LLKAKYFSSSPSLLRPDFLISEFHRLSVRHNELAASLFTTRGYADLLHAKSPALLWDRVVQLTTKMSGDWRRQTTERCTALEVRTSCQTVAGAILLQPGPPVMLWVYHVLLATNKHSIDSVYTCMLVPSYLPLYLLYYSLLHSLLGARVPLGHQFNLYNLNYII
jgi:hypothetical protein